MYIGNQVYVTGIIDKTLINKACAWFTLDKTSCNHNHSKPNKHSDSSTICAYSSFKVNACIDHLIGDVMLCRLVGSGYNSSLHREHTWA